VATLIDREFIADSVLQNSVLPVASLVPEGNAFWHNPGSTPLGRRMSRKERFVAARRLLQSAGFGWDIEPMWDAENEEVLAGTTLKHPDGSVLDEIELLVPSADYGPARAVAATWIAQWCNDMGIPVKPNPTGFADIIPQVFEPAPDTGEIGYDWYILGWGLGSPAFPTFPEAFFACGNDAQEGGFNTPGYCDEEFDEMAAGMMSSRTLEEAREYVWAMDKKLAQDVPYVTLFTMPIVEFYAKTRVQYPYVDTLDGLQYQGGSPDLVTVP
jgi:peptide/nickel transport system substrate-binding protein